EHGTHHEEVAMRQIDDVEQTEDDGKTQRDQCNDQAPNQSVHCQQQERFHRSPGWFDDRPRGQASTGEVKESIRGGFPLSGGNENWWANPVRSAPLIVSKFPSRPETV